MSKDQSIGAVMLVAAIAGILIYGWLLYAYPLIVLQVTAFLAVAMILVIVGWIGWTMATTPPPAPLEPSTAEPPKAESSSTQTPS